MSKTAFITGITGQDGAYLAELLLKKGYKVFGGYRRTSSPNFWRIEELKIQNDVELMEVDILDTGNLIRTFDKVKPEEVYNLAAQSFVAVSFEKPVLTGEITAIGVTRVLEAIRIVNPKIRFYQASSSEMFGLVQEIPQRESTPFYPKSPYATAKLYGHWLTINYRESYNIFGCSGILFNHESPLRGIEFVTRKVSDAIARIKLGKLDCFEIGNMDAKRDWGYAKEFVEGMWMMLQQPKPKDYVLATNENHSVREFIEYAFNYVGIPIEWKGSGVNETGLDAKSGKTLVKINPRFFRPGEVDQLLGDYSLAKKELGWEPKVKFKELVEIMVQRDLERVKQS
ncbi:MAG TPA: GDP-mannose 4,6-dehydratase [Spirochaetota bacterium]|nr:GDP-mannose 4,6-dehydratase [Spirochaetota bacterium]HPL18643.1 GDP-mannose 4,6-dehydratase [Spirochaetota bacterium]HQF08688.1 GDP-mannose 4,6-dehydratase [Spirochaetota bacterium]HRS79529.1 GDP-mannose 4,6-dehydratase [Spirochaetota bacterium]HRT77465.1 GDP-mannose 4,6-dehydratase [Spirochaetota bacterium]